MHKNKIVLMLALGLMISPFFAVQAVVTTDTKIPPVKSRDAIVAELKAKIKKEPNTVKIDPETLKVNLMKETDAIKKNIETSNVETTKVIEGTKDSAKTKLAVKAQKNVNTLLEKIYNNLNSGIQKLKTVDSKIFAKINTAEKAGLNVTRIKDQYTIAKTALDKANADILSTKMSATEQINQETSKETLRALVKTAEDSIKAAGVEYQKIIPLITTTNDTKVETTTTSTVTQ